MDELLVGSWRVDVSGNRIDHADKVVHLEPRVMAVLRRLVDGHGEVVARGILLDCVWRNRVVADDALSNAVIKLRKALGDDARDPRYIETVPKVGYRLIAPVSRRPAPRVGDRGDGRALPSRASIAVLPFCNLGRDPRCEIFGDGMSEDIITALSRFRALAVAARGSSFAYWQKGVDVREVSHALGVRYVLEGSVRGSDERVRVTACLSEAFEGRQVWAGRFDRPLGDMFSVQDDITERIVGAVDPAIGRLERHTTRRHRTEDLDAWGCYHRGLSWMYERTPHGYARAEHALRASVDRDPGFAPAYAALAYAIGQSVVYGNAPDSVYETTNRTAVELAHRAIALDAEDALAHCALSCALLHLKEFRTAVDVARRSVDLNPASATVRRSLGFALLHAGESAFAIEQFQRALTLSPRDPERWSLCHGLAMAYVATREVELALSWAEAAVTADRAGPWAHVTWTAALALGGKREEAAHALATVRARIRNFSVDHARHLLARLSRSDYTDVMVEGLLLATGDASARRALVSRSR